MTASNKALFAQLPVPLGARLTTQGTADGATADLILTAGPEGACIKRIIASTVGTDMNAATRIGIFMETQAGVRINRAPITLPSRVANAAPVYAFQPEATAIDPIEVPPNAKVYAAYITTSANIQIDVAGDAYHYTKADAS